MHYQNQNDGEITTVSDMKINHLLLNEKKDEKRMEIPEEKIIFSSSR